jgi:hypothetical protein
MNWQKLIAYILGGVALVVLGWLLHSAFTPKPTSEVKETVKYDTVKVVKQVKFTETKYIDRYISKDSARTYVDSTMGTKSEVDYKIKHTIRDDKKVLSDWEVNLEPKINIVTKYVTKDSVRTIVEAKYYQAPFFLNTYFYTTIVTTVIAILAIIF